MKDEKTKTSDTVKELEPSWINGNNPVVEDKKCKGKETTLTPAKEEPKETPTKSSETGKTSNKSSTKKKKASTTKTVTKKEVKRGDTKTKKTESKKTDNEAVDLKKEEKQLEIKVKELEKLVKAPPAVESVPLIATDSTESSISKGKSPGTRKRKNSDSSLSKDKSRKSKVKPEVTSCFLLKVYKMLHRYKNCGTLKTIWLL